jgi:DNA-binding CsgD family transcriptional regulator
MLQVFHGVALALLDLAEKTPIMIGVDDIRYADVPSLDLLAYIVRRIKSTRILATFSDDLDQHPAHSPLRAELFRQPNLRRVRLDPLTGSAVLRWLADRLDNDAAHHLAADFYQASGGNLALLNALVSDHQLDSGPRRQGYGQALLDCVYRSEPIALDVVRAVAVLGDGASPEKVGSLVNAGPETVSRVLQTLTSAGLLENNALRHPVARSVVLDDMSPQESAELYCRTAHLLQEQGAPATTVARLLVSADYTRSSWVTGVLLEAARQTLAADQLQPAVEYLALAERACTQQEDRAEILAKLAAVGGQLSPSAAARHLTALVTAMRTNRLGLRASIGLVWHLAWHGRTADLVDVLGQLRSRRMEQHGAADVDLHNMEIWLACTYPALALPRQTVAAPAAKNNAAALRSDPWLLSAAALAHGFVRLERRDVERGVNNVLPNLSLDRDSPWAGETGLLAVLSLAYVDKPVAGAILCDKLLAEANARHAPTLQAIFVCAKAEIALRQGNLRAALNQACEAMALVPPQGWGVVVGLPSGCAILAAVRMGKYDLAAEYVTRSFPEGMFSSRYALHYLYARGHYHLARKHFQAALADFLSCGELVQKWGISGVGAVSWRTAAAEVWLRQDNPDQAKRLVYDELARLGTDGLRSRGLALRLLAAISPPGQRPQLLTEAVELLEDCGDMFELARALTDLSRAHHGAARQKLARGLAQRAWHLAKSCEAEPLCQELLTVGEHPNPALPAARSSGNGKVAALTAAERRVAALAAIGYTNREIAAKLHITTSTVEQHLTKVFRKLDVKQRRELPADLDFGEPSPRTG